MLDVLDYRRLCTEGRNIERVRKICELPRFAEALVTDEGKITYRLEFSKDLSGQLFVDAHIAGTVSVECQRCMHPVDLPLDGGSKMQVVFKAEQVADVVADREALLVIDNEPNLTTLLEDECLLLIPLVPKCATACNAHLMPEKIELPNRTDNPFDILKTLKSSD